MNAKFTLGDVVITRTAAGRVDCRDVHGALLRHAQGDWGECCPEDWHENEVALAAGFRLLSVYRDRKGTQFWVITEADRSVTTILLPEDY